MSLPILDPATANFTWTDPTQNTDGSTVSAGEITGYQLGIRSTTASGSVAGTYPLLVPVSGASAVSEKLSAIGTVLKPDTYAAAIQTVGPVNSAFSAEIEFVIAQPVPMPPSGFTAS